MIHSGNLEHYSAYKIEIFWTVMTCSFVVRYKLFKVSYRNTTRCHKTEDDLKHHRREDFKTCITQHKY